MSKTEVEQFMSENQVTWSRWDDDPPLERYKIQNKLKPGESVKLGIPNKGPLLTGSEALLRKSGANFAKKERQLVVDIPSTTGDTVDLLKLVYMRPRTIVERVASGDLEIGIVATDTVADSDLVVRTLLDLGFGQSRLVVAVDRRLWRFRARVPSSWPFEKSVKFRIGTSRPRVTERFFQEQGIPVEIVAAPGATEGMIKAGWADAIAEIEETGQTIEDNDLEVVATILKNQAILIANPDLDPSSRTSLITNQLVYRLGQTLDNEKVERRIKVPVRPYYDYWNLFAQS